MKLIIAGGRDLTDYLFLKEKLDHLLSRTEEKIEIVCGDARGADSLGKLYGKCRNYSIKSFPADWDKYGKSAGYRRNAEMADYADHLIAFWDGKSKGTKHMIDLAKPKGLRSRIITYGDRQTREVSRQFTIVNGNIFDHPTEAYINPVNCQGVMGAGLAKQMAQRYPVMLAEYKEACSNKLYQPGRVHLHTTEPFIINFPTKDQWTDSSRLEWIESGLIHLKDFIDFKEISLISIPKIGCGLGKLDWHDVRQLIVYILGYTNCKYQIFS